MAAIATLIRVKCTDIQPAVAGRPEVVTLEEETSRLTTESNAHVMPMGNKANLAPRPLILTLDAAAAQGKFVKGKSYKVEFTAL